MESETTKATPLDALVRLRLVAKNARLVDARKAKGFTQPQLASSCHINITYYSQIENLRRCPTEDEICRISVFLEQLPDYLFPEKLLVAVQTGVFAKRMIELESPQLDRLIERRLPPLLTDGGIKEVESNIDMETLGCELRKVIAKLKPQEAYVVKQRYGFDDEEPRSVIEISQELGVTRQRVDQIEAKAFGRFQGLRLSGKLRRLKSFLDA
jgi:transcriptional regulator with XRE-family HTH domain